MIKYWWDKLQNQCPKCKKYLALEIKKETENFIYWECKFCNYKKKHERPWGIYKHKGNRSFLKTKKSGKYIEVGLKITDKYIQVVPIEQASTQTKIL